MKIRKASDLHARRFVHIRHNLLGIGFPIQQLRAGIILFLPSAAHKPAKVPGSLSKGFLRNLLLKKQRQGNLPPEKFRQFLLLQPGENLQDPAVIGGNSIGFAADHRLLG